MDPCLRHFGITWPCTRVPVGECEWVPAVLRVEERATGTASQESNNRPLRGMFGKARRLHACGPRGAAAGQWKTNTQTDADVLTAAEAFCENKTGRNGEKLVNKQKNVEMSVIQQSGVPAGGHGVVSCYSSLREQIGDLFCIA